jgi:hypothetical protein
LLGGDSIVTLKPDYDSGWVQTSMHPPSPTQIFTFNHNLNTTDLLVDIVRQIGRGAPENIMPSGNSYSWGLTQTEIKVFATDQFMQFRVRLWKV